MIEIETMDTGCVLPAFVVGYEVGSVRHEDPDVPPEGEILVLGLQTGGYSVGLATVVGAVLRLEANARYGKGSVKNLVRGLKAMAQDPDYALLEREYPLLRGFTGTHGKPFSRADLRLLELYLLRYFEVPKILDGIEAFVQFEICEPLKYFSGWSVLSAKRRSHVPQDTFHFEVGLEKELFLEDTVSLNASLIRHICDVGMSFGKQGPPSVFLLWENCD